MKELDPGRLLEKLRQRHRRFRKKVNGQRLEFYHRASTARRIELQGSTEPTLAREGAEEGVAVRLDAAFAASSGGDDKSLHWALDRARAFPAEGEPQSRAERAGEFLDLDQDIDMPSAAELRGWLERALGRLPERPVRAWVEAAATVESLVADGGLSASRSRCRAWAMAWVKGRPLTIASRRWRELPEEGWIELLSDRERAGGGRSLLFTAECAAKLVSALVRSFHDDESRIGEPAGAGWKLFDDPGAPGALFGGSFDDAAFPTARIALADGERVCGAISGPGNLRRPSFRDPPQPLPSHLVVEPGQAERQDECLLISELTIHPLSPGQWALQIGDGLIRTAPEELIRNCAAGIGPQRAAHNGVVTPALLFEGLRLRR